MTQPTKITVSFKKSPDYKLYPVSGAWGCPTTDGHILMNLMLEHAAMPNYQTLPVAEDGSVNTAEPIESVAAGDGEREILCGIVVAPHTARNLAKWLNMMADRLTEGKNE